MKNKSIKSLSSRTKKLSELIEKLKENKKILNQIIRIINKRCKHEITIQFYKANEYKRTINDILEFLSRINPDNQEELKEALIKVQNTLNGTNDEFYGSKVVWCKLCGAIDNNASWIYPKISSPILKEQ